MSNLDQLKPIHKQTLEAVQRFIQAHGYSPTIREVSGALGLSQTPTTLRLQRLKKLGLITWNEGQARGIRLVKPQSDSSPLRRFMEELPDEILEAVLRKWLPANALQFTRERVIEQLEEIYSRG